MPGITGLSELTLEAKDPEALARFYVQHFGLPELSNERDRIWLGLGRRARLGIWSPGSKEFNDRGGAHVHFALTVEPGALDDLTTRLRHGGVDVEGPIEHPGGDRSIYVRDLEGNVVEAWDIFERPGRDTSDLEDDGE
jgi:catechol-2,3-dioxygenase